LTFGVAGIPAMLLVAFRIGKALGLVPFVAIKPMAVLISNSVGRSMSVNGKTASCMAMALGLNLMEASPPENS
jgi:hypothetical protein